MNYREITFKPEVRTVCFDIDGTLIDERIPGGQIHSRHLGGNCLLGILAGHLSEVRPDAESAILSYIQENVFWDYDDIVRYFGLDVELAMSSLRDWHLREFVVLWDRVKWLYDLHEQGYRIQIVSNNPRTGCRMKVELAGLGLPGGENILHGVFGSNNGLGQKHELGFWERVIEQSATPAGEMAMVGDNPFEDSVVPLQAGFAQAYIVSEESIPVAVERVRQSSMVSLAPNS